MGISQVELDRLFSALGIWDKINDGRMTSVHIPRAQRPARDYPGGTSDIVRHMGQLNNHVATTHRITMADGTIPHWDAKDIRIGEIIIYAE